jgi:hypothetical protein
LNRPFDLATVGCAVCWAAVLASISPGVAVAANRSEAAELADRGFEHYQARRFRAAAESFMQAWRLSGVRAQLRNAAKAYEDGEFYSEALEAWQRLRDLPDPSPDGLATAERKELALQRKEAWLHARDMQVVIGRQLQEDAEQAYEKREFRKAGDSFVDAFQRGGRQDPGLLRYAAKAYQEGELQDEALVGWQRYADAPGVGTIGRQEAARQVKAIESEIVASRRDAAAYDAFRAGRFRQAAQAFVDAFGQGPGHRSQLRMAAVAYERAGDAKKAAEAWERYAALPDVAQMGREEAEQRTRALRYQVLVATARGHIAAGRFVQGGDAWLEAFTLDAGRDPRALREAAVAFEAASDFARARAMWLRLATAPEVRDEDQDAAADRAEDVALAAHRGQKPASSPPTLGALNAARLDTARKPGDACIACRVVAGTGAASVVAAAILFGLAAERSIALSQQIGQRDANGKTTGIHAEAARRESEAIESQRTAGWIAAGAGVTALITALAVEAASRDKPAERTAAAAWHIAPLPGGMWAAVGVASW